MSIYTWHIQIGWKLRQIDDCYRCSTSEAWSSDGLMHSPLWTRQKCEDDAGEEPDLVDIPQFGGNRHGGGRLCCYSPLQVLHLSPKLQEQDRYTCLAHSTNSDVLDFKVKLWSSLSFVCDFASEKWGETEPLSRATTPSLVRVWNLQLRPTPDPDIGFLHMYMAG